jgi:hypothetical protein
MKPRIKLREALEDKNLLDFGDPSWIAWRTLLLASRGEQLLPEEFEHFRKLTAREEIPTAPVSEFWGVVGRRGGKSRAIAALAVYIACLCEHTLAVGEVGRVIIVAGDRGQAAHVLKYCAGIIEASPILRQLVARQTSEEIELKSGIVIAVGTSNFRRVRGVTSVAAICDEIAFWYSDDSSNPDSEILTALRPTLATTGGPLIAISSPYARRGEMWAAYNRDYGPDGDPQVLVAQGSTTDLNLSGLPALLSWIKRRYEKDSVDATAEIGAQFRTDLESFVSPEKVDACTDPDFERTYHEGFGYLAFIDPSGGSADSMTMAIAHVEGDIAVLDLVREIIPPFNPSEVVEEFCAVMRGYKINRCLGDKYAMEWVVSAFSANGVLYEHTEETKSELYGSLLPMLNSGTVALLTHDRLRRQLLSLERRTGRGGRDIIDHPRNQHDDVANAVAGALVLAKLEPGSTPVPGWENGATINYPEMGIA